MPAIRRLAGLVALGTLLAALCGCASLTPPPKGMPSAARDVSRPAKQNGNVPPHKVIVTYEPATAPRLVDDASETNVRVNQDASGRNQNETTIAISPISPEIIIGGANDARFGTWTAAYYASSDGGATWTDGAMPFRKYANQGDPTVAFCGDGTAVFGYLDYVGAYQDHRLVVGNTSDGGATWNGPGVVYEGRSPFADKPYIACAPAGGTYGSRAYISWTHFGLGSSPIRFAYSTDRGISWTGAKNISSSNGVQGSVPVAGKNGVVYVLWLGGGSITFAKSTNGGGTFGAEQAIEAVSQIGDSPYFRRNSFPSAGVDNSSGPYAGNVYVVWADRRFGDADILFMRSTNGGATWSLPIRINDDPQGNGREQYFPWLAVDDAGDVHVMWHDQRHDSAQREFHIYVATSRDGGLAFDRNLRVSDRASNGSATNFLGDYAAIAAQGGIIAPLWSDLRTGTGEEDAYLELEPAYRYDIVRDARFLADGETFAFESQSPRLGVGIAYDVLTGDVSDLRSPAPWTLATCAADNAGTTSVAIAEKPLPGRALYVLVRAQGPRGNGSWGSGSAHPDPRDGFDDLSPCS